MGPLFNLIFVFVPAAIVYSLFGLVVLALLKKSINITSLAVFVGSGGVFGFLSMVLYRMVFADNSNRLNTSGEVIGMFLTSGASAILGSLIAIRLTTKKP